MNAQVPKTNTHVVDILGNVIGRDQPIMLMERAIELVSHLGDDIFKDDDVIFFDPFCKAGEVLLACAYSSCLAKSRSNSKILSLDSIQDELYKSNRYFALAPDERHHRLSLRTFLGNTNSHNEKYNHIIRDGHYLSEVDGRFDKIRFETEFKSMIEYIRNTKKSKKIIAIGNPPYQEDDGEKPLYNIFVEHLIDAQCFSEFILVIPSRWFAGGRNLDGFREKIVTSKNIKYLRYFEQAQEVFPTVQVKGGVCFLHWDREHNGNTVFDHGKGKTVVDLSKYDIIPDDPGATEIVEKIQSKWKGEYVSSIAWGGKPFGLRTYYFDRNDEADKKDPSAIPCYTNLRKIKYVLRSAVDKNEDKIDEWKVAIPNAYGRGMARCTLRREHFFIINKGEITTETYNVVGCFTTKSEAENFLEFLRTDFSRYLLGTRKLTQHIPKDRWAWVPLMDTKKKWSDEEIFKYFNLTKDEIAHIRKKVLEWT